MTLAPDLPDTASALERQFAYFWRVLADGAPTYEHEYRFAAHAAGGPGRGLRVRLAVSGLRDWRFDFAWPEHKLAVEIEGGTHNNGRHTRGQGYAADCEKYNAAVLLGWRVLRFTSEMLTQERAQKTIGQVLEALGR